MAEQEGVIKFCLEHDTQSKLWTENLAHNDTFVELKVWRDLCCKLKLLGQDPELYQGYGYGNISARESKDRFMISASQTSGHEVSDASHFARVLSADVDENRIQSQGLLPPSSESMTHAALYQIAPEVNWVVHSHCADIWCNSDVLGLAYTEQAIPYGTPAMARAVQQLYLTQPEKNQGIFVMKGHEDGVVTYGHTAEQAVSIMLKNYAKARCLRSA